MCCAESWGVLSLMAVDVRGSSAGWLVVCVWKNRRGGFEGRQAGRRQVAATVVPIVDDMPACFDLGGCSSAPRLSRPSRPRSWRQAERGGGSVSPSVPAQKREKKKNSIELKIQGR